VFGPNAQSSLVTYDIDMISIALIGIKFLKFVYLCLYTNLVYLDELSTMIEQSISEQLNDETLNSLVFPSSQIYKSNGSVTCQPQDHHPTSLQNLPVKKKRGIEALPITGRTRTNAPMQLPVQLLAC
jgi:hypothetical protein